MAEPIAEQLGRVRGGLVRLRAVVQQRRDESAAGALSAVGALDLLADLRNARARMAEIPRTAWLASQATALWNYQGTLATDFTAVEAAVVNLGNWIAARDTVLWANYDINPTTWAETIPVFSIAATVGFRTEVDALLAALDAFLGRIQ